jgi:hypothetical protein
MTASELTVVAAAGFLAAAALGALLALIVLRLNRRPPAPLPGAAEIAARIGAAEAARDAAEAERDETAARATRRIAELEAELAATMEGLGLARREGAALRERLDAAESGGRNGEA